MASARVGLTVPKDPEKKGAARGGREFNKVQKWTGCESRAYNGFVL